MFDRATTFLGWCKSVIRGIWKRKSQLTRELIKSPFFPILFIGEVVKGAVIAKVTVGVPDTSCESTRPHRNYRDSGLDGTRRSGTMGPTGKSVLGGENSAHEKMLDYIMQRNGQRSPWASNETPPGKGQPGQ